MYGNIKNRREYKCPNINNLHNLRKDESLMSIIKKRLFALLMTVVMALSLSVSAFAAEPIDVTAEPTTAVSEEAITRASLGDVIAAGSATINGGSGVLFVTLSSGNFWADISAGIGYSPERGVVTCSVQTPDGDVISLGSVSGSGSMTISREMFYAPAGTYAFYFTSALSQPYEVVAYIYD